MNNTNVSRRAYVQAFKEYKRQYEVYRAALLRGAEAPFPVTSLQGLRGYWATLQACARRVSPGDIRECPDPETLASLFRAHPLGRIMAAVSADRVDDGEALPPPNTPFYRPPPPAVVAADGVLSQLT